MFDWLTRYLEKRFAHEILLVEEDEEESSVAARISRRPSRAAQHSAPRRRRRVRRKVVPPSKRFVWGMKVLMVALVSVIVLEALHIVVAGRGNTTLEAGLVGLLTTVASQFLLNENVQKQGK